MNPNNTSGLPMVELHGYFERMKKMCVCTLNESDVFVPSKFFLSKINLFTKTGLVEEINDEIPTLTKTLTLVPCLFIFDHNISKIDLFHMINILSNMLSYPQIESKQYNNFMYWVRYFFPIGLLKRVEKRIKILEKGYLKQN